jgi:hypothetical protein
MSIKLVMTLLVRDEADILEKNLCFHLSRGVDFIVATDNGSTDGSRDILQKYADKGVLWFRDITTHTYEQAKWVSEMAEIAVKKFGATHLFHCDADEFWMPINGSLKSYLPVENEVFYISQLNYLPEVNGGFFSLKKLVVQQPFPPSTDPSLKQQSYRYLLNTQPQKVMTTALFTKIAQGNHLILDKTLQQRIPINHIVVHHFPIRSLAQFKRKITNGGTAYSKNPEQNTSLGWQWKEWYKLHQAGLTKNLYATLCVEENERKLLLANKVLVKTNVPKSILFAEKLFQLNAFAQKFKKGTVT